MHLRIQSIRRHAMKNNYLLVDVVIKPLIHSKTSIKIHDLIKIFIRILDLINGI